MEQCFKWQLCMKRKSLLSAGGLVQLNRGRPAPLQYNAAAAFLTSLYADYLSSSDVPGWNCGPTFLQLKTLRDFARSQVLWLHNMVLKPSSQHILRKKKEPSHKTLCYLQSDISIYRYLQYLELIMS